jgi:hypothetical protein
LVTMATFAPLLAVVAKTSMMAWAVAFPLCAAGIGAGIRRLGSAVTLRYGAFACFAAALCGLLSLWLFDCGPRLGALQLWADSAQCFAGMLGDVTLVAAAFVVAAFVAFFTGFRQVRVDELLPTKR